MRSLASPEEFPPQRQIPSEASHNAFEDIPANLIRAELRLNFTPSYVVVGVYRLLTDKSLYKPAWDKCRHAVLRGLIVGSLWTFLTFNIQRAFIKVALSHPKSILSFGFITRFYHEADDLSHETLFGYRLPFSVSTYIAVLVLGSQITMFLKYFLSRNIRIARERSWDQTIASRGKGPDFWKPYVEEWEFPPMVDESAQHQFEGFFQRWFARIVLDKLLFFVVPLYPFVGIFVSAWWKALGAAHSLHKPYFAAKKMTQHQVAVFIEERKWHYRLFGFAAALLEQIPIIGLFFSVSNRIGAAMWAHDLEKRQHFIASKRLQIVGEGFNNSNLSSVSVSPLKKE